METTNKQHRRQKLALKRELRRNKSARYSLNASPLWRIAGPEKLAALLKMSISEIRAVANRPSYRCFDEKPSKPGKAPRHIQEPRDQTLHLHYQFTKLLDRIERPDFLHSATKKRSHITNAASHQGNNPIVSTDIEKFYENTTRAHVKNFLLHDMHWPIDLASLMADALTIDGHLPTGSAVSPILSYFAHHVKFKKIEALCKSRGCQITLFIDDISISGEHASMSLLKMVKSILHSSGLRTHKDRSAPEGSSVIITGVVRTRDGIRLRNKHRKDINESLKNIESGESEPTDSLRSKISAAKCVDPVGIAPLERKFNILNKSPSRAAPTKADQSPAQK